VFIHASALVIPSSGFVPWTDCARQIEKAAARHHDMFPSIETSVSGVVAGRLKGGHVNRGKGVP
jgi:hypothetical protein